PDEDDRDNECTICLEPLLDTQLVGIVPSCCGHNKPYHDRCITQWSCNSNSCPTCRQRFYTVEIYPKNKPTMLVHTISVQDKLLTNDAINHIPSEYVIPAAAPAPVEDEIRHGGVCSICSSSDYVSSMRSMLNCNFCCSSFHLDCVGMSPDTDMCSWCCPICDIDQELIIPYQRSRGTSRTTRTCPTPARSVPRALARTRIIRGTGSSARTPARSARPGLIIHNENNELDDSFLYDNDSDDLMQNNEMLYSRFNDFHAPPVINGGVLLRKEQRAQQNLSKEELQSWQIFDVARNQDPEYISEEVKTEGSESASTGTSSSSNKRRRRKKITPVNEAVVGSSKDMIKDNSSRINNLISQIKTSPLARTPITHAASGVLSASDSPASISPSSNSPMDPTFNDSDTQYDSDSRLQKKHKSLELTLDQKIEIQKYIRSNLRLLYKPNHTEQLPSELIITSEEDYIKINKTISRKIYGHILSEVNNSATSDSTLLDKYFKEDDVTKLKELVDRYVKGEL
ncbi:uncharacterized protein CANTADRAFT_29596, partial [Suhomyces tanzawaensis NRRL Y-17324]